MFQVCWWPFKCSWFRALKSFVCEFFVVGACTLTSVLESLCAIIPLIPFMSIPNLCFAVCTITIVLAFWLGWTSCMCVWVSLVGQVNYSLNVWCYLLNIMPWTPGFEDLAFMVYKVLPEVPIWLLASFFCNV